MRPSTSPTFTGGLHESSPSTTHRVSFNIETNGRAAAGNNSQAEHKTNVINLPWADVRGSEAKYTGEVNLLMQPHGFGFLVYKDGSIFSSIWCNGMPSPKPSAHDQVTTTLEEPSRRRVFDLGDVACPKDMQHPSPECAFEEHCFPIHSFAFILRSSGHWTYAIIANRPVLSGPEASIRFVVDKRGSTKIIKRRQWGKYIRFIRKEGDMSAVDDEQDGRLYQGRVMNQACLDQLSAFSGLGKGVTSPNTLSPIHLPTLPPGEDSHFSRAESANDSCLWGLTP
ncbi:hypothetical protein ACHAXN_000924 [Cyclotella atomus]